MGVIRKIASVSTAGLIDFRSEGEKTARNTKKMLKEMKKANKEEKRG